jgi:hypothetical protein
VLHVVKLPVPVRNMFIAMLLMQRILPFSVYVSQRGIDAVYARLNHAILSHEQKHAPKR